MADILIVTSHFDLLVSIRLVIIVLLPLPQSSAASTPLELVGGISCWPLSIPKMSNITLGLFRLCLEFHIRFRKRWLISLHAMDDGINIQRLCDWIKQHVPSSIRQKTVPQQEQLSRTSKTKRYLKHDSTIGQHLLGDPECAKAYSENCFRIIGRARSSFILGILELGYIKTRDPLLCRQKEFVFALELLK